MKLIQQQSVDRAFEAGAVLNVTVHRASEKEYFFSFLSVDPVTQESGTYILVSQRGKIRTWADPRNLFSFLEERGVTTGDFNLNFTGEINL